MSWVTITLDTVAPEVDLGEVERPLPSRVEVPFTASTDTQEIDATLDVFGGGTLPVTIDDGLLIAEGIPNDALLLTMTVTAEDDVGNVSITTEEFQVSIFSLGAKLTVGPIMRAYMRVLPYIIGREFRAATGFVAKQTIAPILKVSGQVKKILQAAWKIDQGDR